MSVDEKDLTVDIRSEVVSSRWGAVRRPGRSLLSIDDASVFLSNTLKRPTTWLLGGRAVQLANSVLLSAIVVRRFGLGMVGTYAIGYIAVAFTPHILSLGLNSELPRLKRPISELIFVAAIVQATMLALLLPLLCVYSILLARSGAERIVIFVVAISGCFTGLFNCGLTLHILLRRFQRAATAPLLESGMIVLGAVVARSGLQLAVFFLLGRVLAAALMWPRMRPSPVGYREILPIARQGTKYLLLDLLVTLSEQIIPLVLGVVAPRSELGIFRLCQQTASAAETPVWSYVQGKYPEIAEGNAEKNSLITRRAIKIGAGAAVLLALSALPIAFLIFHTPVVASMMLVLSAALVSRYLMYASDQRLRAEGRITASLTLVCVRILLFSIALALTVKHFGVWAGIWTNSIGAILFGYVYRRTSEQPLSAVTMRERRA